MALSTTQIADLLGSNSEPVKIDPEPSREAPQPRQSAPAAKTPLMERADRATPQTRGNALIKHPEIAQAPQIELAVLAALYLHPEHCFPIFNERAKPDFFFNPVYRTFYGLISDYFDEHRHIDISAFVQHISDLGQFEKIGGPPFLADLLSTTSPVTAFTYHTDILRDKYVAREVSRLASNLATKIQSSTEDEMWTVMAQNDRAMSDLRALATDKLEGIEHYTCEALMSADTKNDPNNLLGRRWLCRGSSCLWAAPAGIGKSTLQMQAAAYWACGSAFFGIKPVQPLKNLIIQAENDFFDTAEQLQGVIAAIKSDIPLNGEVSRMLIIERSIKATGDRFLSLVKQLIKIHSPDLVWIDPMFAFAGCDLLDAEKVGRFLREGLFPMAAEHGVCLHVIHHVGKSTQDSKSKSHWTEIDYQYLGFGTSEIQNAFRAVNILVPVADESNAYRLILSKRGARAGVTDEQGLPSRNLYLSHSKEGQAWVQIDEPEGTTKKRPSQYNQSHLLDNMSVVHGLPTNQLCSHIMTETGMARATFYRFFEELKTAGLIRLDTDNKWIIAPTKKSH